MTFRPHFIGIAALLAVGLPRADAAAPSPPSIVGCPSLVNLRMMMQQTKQDVAAAAAILGNDQADHLGCAMLTRDAVTGLQEHLSLNGTDYACLALRSTSVCHWVIAGAVDFTQPPAKPRSGDRAKAPEKARR